MREQRQMCVAPEVVAVMRPAISSQKPDEIQHRFGIGLNTWAKLRDGKAIRHSVAVRLINRLERDRLI